MNKIQIPDWKLLLNIIGKKVILKNIPLMFYMTCLAIIYISINHYAENKERESEKMAKELKELRWKYIDAKTQIMILTKESKLEQSANKIGLNVTKMPPYKIEITQ